MNVIIDLVRPSSVGAPLCIAVYLDGRYDVAKQKRKCEGARKGGI
jgi:hypothetical protein